MSSDNAEVKDVRMDQLLRQSLGSEPPKLSSRFDRELDKRVHPPRLSSKSRKVLAAYTAGALVISAWVLSDLPIAALVAIAVFTLISPTMLFLANRRNWGRRNWGR
jgi:hypothetical protein